MVDVRLSSLRSAIISLAFLRRLTSPKCLHQLDRRRQMVSFLFYSPASLQYLVSHLENETDLFQCSLECLLAEDRGFTLDRLGEQGRAMLWKIASSSRDYARLILSRWINEKDGHDLVHILQFSSLAEEESQVRNEHIDRALKYFLAEENIRRIIISTTKAAIGMNK